MKADEGQAVRLHVAGGPEVGPGIQSGHQDSVVRDPLYSFNSILAVDFPGKNVANHPSNHGFFLQERVVPEIGRDTDGPARAR